MLHPPNSSSSTIQTGPLVLLGLVAVMLLVGLATLNGAVIALGLPIAIYLGMAWLKRPESSPGKASSLMAVRTLGKARISPGQPVTVTLTLTNQGELREELLVRDHVPPGLQLLDGQTSVLAELPSGGQLTLQYQVSGARGEYDFRTVQVTIGESFGVFQYSEVLSAAATLLVRPEVRTLRPFVLRPPRTRGFAGPVPSRQSGSGIDFFGLRDYQMGDRLHWVNWRVSARHERGLYTNEFEQERIADIGLILDARSQNDVRTVEGTLYDHTIQASASLAGMFLSQGNHVGLWIYGRGREGVFPGYGRFQRERILRALGRATTGHNYALESLDHLPWQFFPSGSQIVFIGPLTGIDDVPVLTRLRANGYGLLVVSPNPLLYEMSQVGNLPGARVALRIGQVERHSALSQLRRAGAQVVDWHVDQPLDEALHAALSRQPVREHAIRRV